MVVHLTVAALSAATGAGATVVTQHVMASGEDAAGTPLAAAAEQHEAMNDQAVYKQVEPGVVDVTSTLGYLEETAKGTGFVIDAADGLVLTNNHVIDQATSVTVTLVTSGKTYPARILGYDAADDVALLQVRGAALTAVRIGDSSRVDVGMPVLAIGNEAGQGGAPTVAPGVISSLGRTIVASDQSSGLTETLHGMFQTSADIRPGDSGGPLADASGRVIGIDTAAGGNIVYSGYAIPINQAMPIARQIAAGWAGRPGQGEPGRSGPGQDSPGQGEPGRSGRIQIGLPAFLGVLLPGGASSGSERADNSGSERADSQELRQDGAVSSGDRACSGTSDIPATPVHVAPVRSGALVDGVLCGTPASQAGISAGDVITSVAGEQVSSPGSLTALLSRYHPGSVVPLAWTGPDGSLHAAAVTLAAGPAG
ncbi:MAG TPA: trypsin-like peptidase domain-containing protein [Streptosporangiaceae bacterium]|nr:trypsin-like peptidase domain-containing protein [Streptosporangiaceae bacterium]